MFLIPLQMLAVLVATVAAVVDIESIVFAGPLLSVTGAMLAVRSYRRNRPWGLYLGLASPGMAAFCFALICVLRWGPLEAARPVAALLIVFALLHLVLGVLACREALRPYELPLRPAQFSIFTMLVLTFLVAMFLGLAKTGKQELLAWAVLLTVSMLIAYVLRRFHAGRPAPTGRYTGEPPETAESLL